MQKSSIVHASCHLCNRMHLQTHLESHLPFVERSQPLPVPMTITYHQESLQRLLVHSHLHTATQNLMKVCCTLAVEYTFQSIFGIMLVFDKTVLDFFHFYSMFEKIFLMSAEWLILSTVKLHIRKADSLHNDHVENPKS
jgi:hypothetical protein